jgi:hypothetical protein
MDHATASLSQRVYGVDFSSAPSVKKPITVAVGELRDAIYTLDQVIGLPSLSGFESFLAHPGPWVAGFDLPFSLPRPLIEHYNWPHDWPAFIRWYGAQSRAQLRDWFKAFCDARPVGGKYAYRRTDKPAGSSPAMRWTNPPVAWMLHAGAPRILEAGLHVPGLHEGQDPPDRQRIALEAYPGFTARKVARHSYKTDDPKKQTPERQQARKVLLTALMAGRAGLNVRLSISLTWQRRMIADGSGDLIDSAICALQAAHAMALPDFGFPDDLDPLEGWIASV